MLPRGKFRMPAVKCEIRARSYLYIKVVLQEENHFGSKVIGILSQLIESMNTSPLEGLRIPANILSVVDFPTPFSPKNPTISCRWMEKLMLDIAAKSP